MKFSNLFSKEIKELINRQAIFTMVFTMVLLIIMGQFFGQALNSADTVSGKAYIINRDNTPFTRSVLEAVSENTDIILGDPTETPEEALVSQNGVIVIPEGFSNSILNAKVPGKIDYYAKVSFAGLSAVESLSGGDAVGGIFAAAKDEALLVSYGLSEKDITLLNSVAETVDFSVYGGKTAQVSASAISGVMMMQMMIAPMVIFILLLMASQMIMVAISTEKMDKTLETLLSAPVSRLDVLLAKMTAAVVSALLNAAFMAVGMVFYMSGFAGAAITDTSAVSEAFGGEAINTAMTVAQGMVSLGLTLTPMDYFLFFIQLFFSVAIGLAAALMMGAMATDAKSLQTLILPIMMIIMVPFFVTLLGDISKMPLPFQIVMYLIPFTHAYTAIPNLIGGNYALFFGGMAYQIIFFAFAMFLAVKMFTSDKLFTAAYKPTKPQKKKLFAAKQPK
ncbi:MAG: ABC transporter permease [Ruminococcus sp.]|nr:ABC transporter permease [Ruminococcus sp.]